MPRYAELKLELRKAGCYRESEGGNHEWWFSPITNERFQVGRHDREEVKKGMEMEIRKKAGVPKKR